MDLNENTKSGPEQNQPDADAKPDAMQQESPRTCKICGGPNHYGCGCEAKQRKQRRSVGMVETKDSKPAEQPASETDDILEDAFSPEAIKESDKVNREMAKDIKTMADGFEGLCACMYDTNNYLKVIAGDMITIRKFLIKEDKKNEVGMGDIVSYLSVINQRLEEIKAKGQNDKGDQD